METKDILFSLMDREVRNLQLSINSTLFDLLTNEKDGIRIKESEVSEDYSFNDYSGKEYAFVGFKKDGVVISLLGYKIVDDEIDRSELYEIPSYLYASLSLLYAVKWYNNILEERREDERLGCEYQDI